MSKKTLVILMFLAAGWVKAQHSVSYTYDANGNRDSRYFVGMRLANPNFASAEDSASAMAKSTELAIAYGLTVYPNPTRDAINVAMNNAGKDTAELGKAEMFLIDNAGKTVARKKYDGSQTAFDMTNCIPGVYHLKIVFNKNERVDYKVVKINN